MSVATTTSKIQYTLTTGSQALAVPFYFLENSHVKAIRVATDTMPKADLVLGTDYTLTGAGNPSGGTLTTIATVSNGLTAGSKVVIKRNLPITQPTSYSPNDAFPAKVHEAALDRGIMIAQQSDEQSDRAIRFPEDDSTAAELPAVADRASKALGFNASGALEMKTLVGADGILEDESVGESPLQSAFRSRAQASVALMKAQSYTNAKTGDRVELLGYNSRGDGGGGLLYVDKADTTTADNGVTVFVASDGTRLKRVDASVITDKQAGVKGDGSTDDTVRFQAALDASLHVTITGSGVRKITSELTLRTGQVVDIDGGATIRQYTANKPVFKATQKTDILINCNGAVIRGEGSWSDAWTGNEGHEDRGIFLIGCSRVIVNQPRISNCASAGISIQGGSDITINEPIIEGTHTYGVPLSADDNFQNGIHIFNLDAATYGEATNIKVNFPEISGTCQGVLREEYNAGTNADRSTLFVGSNIHDIPGQHAFYVQSGKFNINGATLTNINSGGVKFQSGSANRDIYGCSATGIVAEGLGGPLFEMACLGSGSLKDSVLEGTVNGCEYGFVSRGKVQNVKATVLAKNATNCVAYITGANPGDLDLVLRGENIEDDGILIDATATGKISINAIIRNPNTNDVASGSGIRIESASADVELIDPEFTDTGSKMRYGIFNSVAGSIVKVRGRVKITGATDTATRATGLITEWPTDAELSATNGPHTNYNNVYSSQTMQAKAQSTSASYVNIWARALEDESAFLVRAEICGKLSGSAQRAGYVSTVLVYRDGGDATIEGSADTDVSIASGSFAGVYQWTVSGSSIFLQVSSAGAATYDWTARVSVIPVT